MICSHSELLAYLELEKNQNIFPNGYIIKQIDSKTIVIKTKELPSVHDIKILFFPFSPKFLEKVLNSLKEQQGVKNNDVAMV